MTTKKTREEMRKDGKVSEDRMNQILQTAKGGIEECY